MVNIMVADVLMMLESRVSEAMDTDLALCYVKHSTPDGWALYMLNSVEVNIYLPCI